jgi:hypothetical protein
MDAHRITGQVAAVQSPRVETGHTRDIHPDRDLYGVELTENFAIVGQGWFMMAGTGRGTRLRVLLVGIIVVGLVSAVGCGRSSSSAAGSTGASAVPGAACQHVNSVAFDKTKFVLHAGLAFGAFHHFIYAPYKAGALHGVAALGKAGLAAVFTVHELKLAKADAESSPTLCHLAAPFDRASAAISSSTSQIKSGKVSSQDIESMNNDINAVQHGAAADGVPAPDQVPSDAQLASGARWPWRSDRKVMRNEPHNQAFWVLVGVITVDRDGVPGIPRITTHQQTLS